MKLISNLLTYKV